MNIVLLEPEIPANVGNIGRTCVATGSRLHLIRPLGFSISDRAIKRSGMDYWQRLDLQVYDDYDDFLKKNPGSCPYMATTKAEKTYSEVIYQADSYIMFGKESAGIPEELLVNHPKQAIRIPMQQTIRSLNLANSVAIILYEGLRQRQFEGLQSAGDLHRLHWTN